MTLGRFALSLALFVGPVAAQELRFAELGDFKLASGEVLRDCRIGYRTFGKLNAERSNAILVPTWANGTTAQMSFGPDSPPDPSQYFVIAVDALSNGVSSSPSNSRLQPRMKFPKFTFRDLVKSQHELLTRVLRIDHLRAVMGLSMGGMQTFQWMVSYPAFMDKAIPIVGSPRLAPYDLMHWQTQLDAIVNHRDWRDGEYTENFEALAEVEFGAILLETPEHYNAHTTRQQVFERLKNARTTVDANNKVRQVQAMLALDVSDAFGGSMDAAASAVRAKALVITARQDHVVTPEPAREFARRLHAETLDLEGSCGHSAPSCEGAKVAAAVREFLAR